MKRRKTRLVPRPPSGAPIHDFAFLAMVSTWMEADVIEACVANARRQGCDAVYLLDDGSPDDTVARAEGAGAIVTEPWTSERWAPEVTRNRRQTHATRLADEHGAEHTWWLFLDADEFPQGRLGRTVREQLATLDEPIRVVGSMFLNHVPSGVPANLPGFHPADCQPLLYPRHGHACEAGHFKHQLLRFDRGRRPLEIGYGAHRVGGERRIVEAVETILVRHFQYREEAVTRERLAALADRMSEDDGRQIRPGRSAWARLRDVDAVYRGDWDAVRDDGTREMGISDVLTTAEVILPPEDAALQTWYSPDELAAARERAP